jgi:dipeptidase E
MAKARQRVRQQRLMESKKRKLVLYSGGNHNWGNERLHPTLIELAGKKSRSMTYIPSTHENGEIFFQRFKKRYSKFGVKKFRYFPVDADFHKFELKEALKSDIIYLAGGNTFYFLKHLRASGFLTELEIFIARGGIVAGLSAGAIILTPNIWLAGYPPHEGDENEVRLKDLRSLHAVGFEFLPHYTGSAKTNKAMLEHSRKSPFPVVACPDGSGVIVDGDEVRFFGPAYIFVQGKRARIA